ATNAVALRGFLEHQSAPWPLGIFLALVAVFLACFVISTFWAIRALYPDVTRREQDEGRRSPLYFGTIAAMPLGEFTSHMRGLDADGVEEELLRQTHINAGIASRKFAYLRLASLFMAMEIAFVVFAAVAVSMPDLERIALPVTVTPSAICVSPERG